MKPHRRILAGLMACLFVLSLSWKITPSAQAAGTLTVPSDWTVVPDQAYYGDRTLYTVIIPEGITSVGNLAFADSSVSVLTLPSSLHFIAEDAFQGTSLVTVNAKTGTYAYSWARDHGFFPEYKALLIGEKTFLDYNPIRQTFFISTASRNVGDVSNMSSMLESVYGPQGGSFSVTGETDLTYSEVHDAISSVFSETKPQDVCLFFIASHGNEAGDGDLFMSFKGDYENEEDRNTYYHGNQLLSFETLAAWLNESCGGRVIVIIEACGSGSAIYAEGVEENSAPAVPSAGMFASSRAVESGAGTDMDFNPDHFNQAAISAFSDMDPGIVLPAVSKNRLRSTGSLRTNKFFVLTAARHHELSYGIEGENAHNYFTSWLLEGIGNASSSPADLSPADQLLTLNELFSYIRDNYNDYSFGTLLDGTNLCQHVQCYPQDSSFPLFSLIKPLKDISGAVISGLSGLEYTGNAVEPVITVELGDDNLLPGIDYDLIWSDNIIPGLASLSLVGKGNYTGVSETEFVISPADITGAELQVNPLVTISTGTEVVPHCKVFLPNGLEATGTVRFLDNILPGTATVFFSGTGYFQGELTGTFTIVDKEDLEMLLLPGQLTAIEECAFEETAAQYAFLPDGVVTIGTKAFANCRNLLLIRIPSSVTWISEDAFEGCSGLTVISSEGSVAQEFAEAYGETSGFLFVPET